MKSVPKIGYLRSFLKGAEFIAEGVNHLLWPRVCNVCREPILKDDDGFCIQCWRKLAECTGADYCRSCGADISLYTQADGTCGNCRNSKNHFDGLVRAGTYEDILRDMILSLKYNDQPELIKYIGPLADAAVDGAIFKNKIDLFVPVPLHWRRRLWRGFNQAMLICKHIGLSDKRISTDLIRKKYTHRQWNLSESARRKNVANAFAVRAGHKFINKNICLVDDITTSGATLNECAKTLKQAGADKIYALVIAAAIGN